MALRRGQRHLPWSKARRGCTGFLPRTTHALMQARDVDAHFSHGKVTHWFGGSSNASTQLLDGMHDRPACLRAHRRLWWPA